MGYTVQDCAGGLTATAGTGGKCVLLRGDMDALKLTEDNGLPYRSTMGMRICAVTICTPRSCWAPPRCRGSVHWAERSDTCVQYEPARSTGLTEPQSTAAQRLHTFIPCPSDRLFYPAFFSLVESAYDQLSKSAAFFPVFPCFDIPYIRFLFQVVPSSPM